MDGKAIHRCLHVLDLQKSLDFYERALGMTVIRQMGPEDGSWSNTFIGNEDSGFQLELTWNRGRTEPYDNGGRDSHLAYTVSDYDAAHALHQAMGCICHENAAMGLYFIEDPDGCWIEILPEKPEFAAQPGVDVLDAMRRRRSVRRYSGEPIPDALMDRIVEAALLAPSGRSRYPWEITVVRDRTRLNLLANCREHGSDMLEGADAAIVVAANPALSDTWIEDCAILMANMHLEAAASGVASCWIQVRGRKALDGRPSRDFVAEALGLPANLDVEAILSLGMPEQSLTPRTPAERLRDKIHYERFDDPSF